MSRTSLTGGLTELARLYGVQTAYYDMDHRRRQADAGALLHVLRALGAPVAKAGDIPTALRERRQALWRQPLEPVSVAWQGEPSSIPLRLPSRAADASPTGLLILENGERRVLRWDAADYPAAGAVEVEGMKYLLKRLPLPGNLPPGYHQLQLDVAGSAWGALIISAPREAYSRQPVERTWGVFIPLYALHSGDSWGSGDLSDLEKLTRWTSAMGGGVVGTLPLLATFLDEPFEPSPYAPASRLMWNEFYLDIGGIPELQRCPEARELMSSTPFRNAIEALRALPLVDYRRQMALKRGVLEKLSRCCFTEAPDRLEELLGFSRENPAVEDYARFRATMESRGQTWPHWPQPLRGGRLKEADCDETAMRYHLYVQWVAHRQFRHLADTARAHRVGLYLDLPLGVHADGYDVWRNQHLFAGEASVGAPPDPAFTSGQDWLVPPLHPEAIRQHRYDYYIACLRHHLSHAPILRTDHVMGLHRLFWIPKGADPSQGVYVRYRADEFYAILALESRRHKAIVVGEDLGTVPPEVRPAMARHGLQRMYVVQYEMSTDHRQNLRAVPGNTVASVNTHDMPPFSAYWKGLDIRRSVDRGLLSKARATAESQSRRKVEEALVSFLERKGWRCGDGGTDSQDVLRAILMYLGASRAHVVLVNLEDLWAETEAQNMPGSGSRHPNWCRRARHNFEAFSRSPSVVDVLRDMDQVRKIGVHHEGKETRNGSAVRQGERADFAGRV